MQMVNETKEPNSATGSGLKNTDFLGLKALFRWLGGKSQKSSERFNIHEEEPGVFFVSDNSGYGVRYTGPYKRKQDAKGVLTRLKKQHG